MRYAYPAPAECADSGGRAELNTLIYTIITYPGTFVKSNRVEDARRGAFTFGQLKNRSK
jgi:hypothetical protein